jgi:hypothetical protein
MLICVQFWLSRWAHDRGLVFKDQHRCGGAGPGFGEPVAGFVAYTLVFGLYMQKAMNDRSNHFF